ncbi:hypothetical protein BH09ACT10_BH09ACT10_18080 [soil metagenome]
MNSARHVLLPALVVAAASLAVGSMVSGVEGLVSAAFASLVVFVFFVSSPLALRMPTKIVPALSMMMALMFFLTKVVALLAVMTVLLDPDRFGQHIDKKVFGLTVVVSTIVWSILQVREATKLRQPLYDLTNND